MSLVTALKKNLMSKNISMNGYLKNKLKDVTPTNLDLEDSSRLNSFQMGLTQIATKFKNEYEMKIYRYSKSDIGHDAIGFISYSEYDKNSDNFLPLFIVSPIFIYAPDVDEFIYKRKKGEGIESLINFKSKWQDFVKNESMSAKEKEEIDEKTASYSEFQEIILPYIQQFMTLNEEEARHFAKDRISKNHHKDVSKKANEILDRIEDIQQMEDELNLRELQYEQDSVELENKITRYNNTVKRFEEKFIELEESLNYVTEMEKELEAKYQKIKSYSERISVYNDEENGHTSESSLNHSKQYFDDHTKVYVDSLIEQVRNTIIAELKGDIADYKKHNYSKEEMEKNIQSKVEYILKSYDESLDELEELDKEPLKLTLSYLEVDTDILSKELAMKLDVPDSRKEEHVKELYEKYLQFIESIFTENGGKTKEDIESMKAIVRFTDKLKGKNGFEIVENNAKSITMLLKRKFEDEYHYYVVSPVLLANLTASKNHHHYAGYSVTNFNTDIGKDDFDFYKHLIAYITNYTMERKGKMKFEAEQVKKIGTTDESWTRRLNNIEHFIKINAINHETLKRYGLNVSVNKDETKTIPLSKTVNYTGGFLVFKGYLGYLIVTENRIAIRQNNNKNLMIKYQTNKEIQEIFSKNKKALSEILVNTSKYSQKDVDKVYSIVTNFIVSGLSLITDYEKIYKKVKEQEN